MFALYAIILPIINKKCFFISFSHYFLAIPVCFILTSNRKQETYEAIFRCLKKIGGVRDIDLKPSTIVCDFERAFMNAVQTEVRNFLRISYSIQKHLFIYVNMT
jgi:hypothetical protein